MQKKFHESTTHNAVRDTARNLLAVLLLAIEDLLREHATATVASQP